MKDILGVKSVYILHDGETYGKGLADQFQRNAKEQGIDILGNDKIDHGTANYRSLMNQIAQDNPDAIYYGGITENGAPQLVKDKIRAGMSNDKVIFMGADGILDNEFLRLADDQGEGVYVTFPGLPPKLLPDKGQAFVKRYQERFPYTKIEATSANAYEAANVLLDAIQRPTRKTGRSPARAW